MNKIELEIDGQKVEATFQTVFTDVIRVNLTSPYQLEYMIGNTKDDECNYFEDEQAVPFVKEQLQNLMKLVSNVAKNREVYQSLYDKYDIIIEIMQRVLRKTQCEKPRLKFRYSIDLQSEVYNEFFNELRQKLPIITEGNQDEYLVSGASLHKILLAI